MDGQFKAILIIAPVSKILKSDYQNVYNIRLTHILCIFGKVTNKGLNHA